jgi:hypothetical protein
MIPAEKYARNLASLVNAGWKLIDAIEFLEACMSDVDKKQEGGDHYKKVPLEFQHWNLVIVHQWTYFQAQAIKYIMRYKDKGGVGDLRKAIHFVEKMIEIENQPTKSAWSGDYLQFVKATGWEGFTFEGADASGFRYRCEKCREEIAIPQYASPHAHHTCGEAPPGWRPA